MNLIRRLPTLLVISLIALLPSWGIAATQRISDRDCIAALRGISLPPEGPRAGLKIRVALEDLRPAQFAVGMSEVEQRSEEFNLLSESEQREYLRRRPLKVILGPQSQIWLVDGHHLALILDAAEYEDARVVIEHDWSALPQKVFFQAMKDFQYFYLFDKNGEGPYDPSELPESIYELENDPFRSLAWRARKKGCFKKTQVPFAEFQWADLFRTAMSRKFAKKHPKRALQLAMELCDSPAARRLPGYIGSEGY